MSARTWQLLAADAILIIHFAFVLFVVLGLGAIWIGWIRKWRFVRRVWFRAAHLGCMGVVVLESVFGIVCPLTTWEKNLRHAVGADIYEETFMQHWVHKAMFFQLPPAVFTAMYILFFLAIVLSLIVVKPEWRNAARGTSSSLRSAAVEVAGEEGEARASGD